MSPATTCDGTAIIRSVLSVSLLLFFGTLNYFQTIQMPDQVGHDENWRAKSALFVVELVFFVSSRAN